MPECVFLDTPDGFLPDGSAGLFCWAFPAGVYRQFFRRVCGFGGFMAFLEGLTATIAEAAVDGAPVGKAFGNQ